MLGICLCFGACDLVALIRWSFTVGRLWSLLFLLVPILGVGCFVWAMAGWWPMEGHWLPREHLDARAA